MGWKHRMSFFTSRFMIFRIWNQDGRNQARRGRGGNPPPPIFSRNISKPCSIKTSYITERLCLQPPTIFRSSEGPRNYMACAMGSQNQKIQWVCTKFVDNLTLILTEWGRIYCKGSFMYYVSTFLGLLDPLLPLPLIHT